MTDDTVLKGKQAHNKHRKPIKQQGRTAVVVQQPRRPNVEAQAVAGFHKVDEETLKYIEEVNEQFNQINEPGEQALLVGNVLEDVASKAVKVSTDAACSRILEALLPAADTQHLLAFFEALLEEEGSALCDLSANPFGSRVAERLLKSLGTALDGACDQTTAHAALVVGAKVLERACSVAIAHLYQFATDRNGSHVARRLLCVLAGRDVTPAQQLRSKDGVDAKALRKPKSSAAGFGAVHTTATDMPAGRHPQLLARFADALLSPAWSRAQLEELLYHAYGSPWLQALLTALAGQGAILARLVPRLLGSPERDTTAEQGEELAETEEGGLLEGIPVAHVHGMMQERTSSHVMEAVVRAVPPMLLAELHARFLRGSLHPLALHPVANFVVQASLAALNHPQQVKGALRELRDALPELLRSRRSGVVAALLAAAARCGNAAVQADAGRAMASALAALQSQHDNSNSNQGLAGALLTADTGVVLGQSGRLSVLGCAMLATLLRLPKEAGAPFSESLADLSDVQLSHAGADSAGSRVLEAFLEGHASAKTKKRALRKLRGSYARLAATPGGSHAVQACYKAGGIKDKEAIAGELAVAEKHIAATRFGQMLLKRCAVEDFKHSSSAWRTRAQSAAALYNEYAELLGEEPDQAAEAGRMGAAGAEPGSAGEGMQAGKVPRKKRRKQAAAQAASAAGADEEQPHEAKMKKKKRKDAASMASAEVAVLAQQPTPQASAETRGQRPDVLGLLLTGTGDLEDVGALTKKKRKKGTHA